MCIYFIIEQDGEHHMIILASALKKAVYKPKDIANMLGCSVRTIQNYCDENRIESYRSIKNRRQVDKDKLIEFLKSIDSFVDDSATQRYDIIYARVSTNKQKADGDLDRQVEKLSAFVVQQNPKNLQIVKEVGSGLNDNRKQLLQIIDMVCDNKVNRIFVMHKDRLTRFGFNYLKMICDKHNAQIVVASDATEDKSVQDELAEDIVALIHSFSGKLYGLRKTIKQKIEAE